MLIELLALAAAASPMPGQTYEGPAESRGGSPATLLVSANGTRVVRLTYGYERGCRRAGRRLPQPQQSVFLRNLKIRGGRFSWRQTLRYPSTGGWVKTTLSGRFSADGTRFTATVRQRMHNPQTRIRCDSGTVRFGGAVPERELVNGSWTGSTAQGRPIRLTIAGDGVTAATVEASLACTNGEQIVLSLTEIDEPGRLFDDDLTFRVGDGQLEVSGTAARGLVRGVVRATGEVTRPDGEDDERTYSCSSGDVAFEAKPG